MKQMHEDVSDYSGSCHAARDPVSVFSLSLEMLEPHWARYAAATGAHRLDPSRRSMDAAARRSKDAAWRSRDGAEGRRSMEGRQSIEAPKFGRTASGQHVWSAPAHNVQKLFWQDLDDAPDILKGGSKVCVCVCVCVCMYVCTYIYI